MNLQVMSDLHFEMHADGGAEFIRGLDPTGVDLLVLAGDITTAQRYSEMETVFKALVKKYQRILYVPGNHEYYRSSPKQVAVNLARLAKDVPEIVIPWNEVVVIGGHRFVAGTMWFRRDPMGELNKRFMNDFSQIEDFEPWVYDQNVAFEKVMATQVEPGDVVVTHHLPTPESVPPRFARSAINAFFLSDMTSYFRDLRPKLWIHGHTHDRCDYTIADTRVVANPFGYPKELGSNTRFDPAFRVEI